VVCARNLAWGYVDHPPLSIAVLRLVIGVFGESLQVIRAVPAIAHAATVLLSGLIVRELHGGRFAARVAMVSAAAAPMVLSLSFFYSMNAFDLVLWCGAVYAVLIALRTERDSAWACVGLWLGLGLLNKVSVLWLGGGLGVALMLTPYRAVIMRRGVWLAAGVAALIFAPHIVWQMQHHWPTLEFMQSASANTMVARSVLTFARAAIADQGPVVALLGVMGSSRLLTMDRPACAHSCVDLHRGVCAARAERHQPNRLPRAGVDAGRHTRRHVDRAPARIARRHRPCVGRGRARAAWRGDIAAGRAGLIDRRVRRLRGRARPQAVD
jgi:hypothetical protein